MKLLFIEVKITFFSKVIIHYIISDRSNNKLKRIEIINEQGSTNGPDMPMELWDHCIIFIDSNTLLTTGGYSNDGQSR